MIDDAVRNSARFCIGGEALGVRQLAAAFRLGLKGGSKLPHSKAPSARGDRP
jgi:hypothetical protein